MSSRRLKYPPLSKADKPSSESEIEIPRKCASQKKRDFQSPKEDITDFLKSKLNRLTQKYETKSDTQSDNSSEHSEQEADDDEVCYSVCYKMFTPHTFKFKHLLFCPLKLLLLPIIDFMNDFMILFVY